jgi:hypothetical protein
MSLTNLTRNINFSISGFNNARSKEMIGKKENNINDFQISKNTIIIPKSKINQIKRNFGFFDTFIDTNFSNSKDFFDKDDNYILKKDLLPEEMIHYDKNTNQSYIIKRNEVWNALPNALSDHHIPNKILADYMTIFFLYKDSLYNPTVPESERINRPNEEYIPGTSRKQLKKTRKQNREIGLYNEYNNYSPFGYTITPRNELIANFEKDKRKEELIKLKTELRRENKGNVEALAEAVFNKNKNIIRAIKETKKAMANRTKYGKNVFKLPINVKTQRKGKLKQKRKTLKRSQQRQRKEQRKEYNWNYNEGNYNEGNYNEEN